MARSFLSLCVLFLAVNHDPSAIGADISTEDMALIPSGEFTMGSPEGSDGFPDERPERRVYLSEFFVDRFEVTNQAYAVFVLATGHRSPANASQAATLWTNNRPIPGIEHHPVVNVS